MPSLPLFITLVFVSAFLLSYLLVVPTLSGDNKLRKKLRRQIEKVQLSHQGEKQISLTRKKYLQALSPFEQRIESLPWVESVARLIEQSDYEIRANRLVLICVCLSLLGFFSVLIFTRQLLFASIVAPCVFFVPIFIVKHNRNKRAMKFEEQLPEALEVIIRGLKAGHPFPRSIQLVSEEMDNPVAKEFSETFAELNYGYDTKTALLNQLDRMPSVSVMAVVTSILIQNETGGNLAEILGNISSVIRARFRLQRKIKTLSAEGKMSAWVLCLLPFVIVVMFQIISPDYLPLLFESDFGKKIVIGILVLMFFGVLWMSRIIKIDI